MGIFRKKKQGPKFFEEEPAEAKFSVLADLCKGAL